MDSTSASSSALHNGCTDAGALRVLSFSVPSARGLNGRKTFRLPTNTPLEARSILPASTFRKRPKLPACLSGAAEKPNGIPAVFAAPYQRRDAKGILKRQPLERLAPLPLAGLPRPVRRNIVALSQRHRRESSNKANRTERFGPAITHSRAPSIPPDHCVNEPVIIEAPAPESKYSR